MGKRKNNISGLVSLLSRQKINGQSLNALLSPADLVGDSRPKTSNSIKPPSLGDTKASSMNARIVSAGIKFGAPSSSRTSTQQSGSEWGNLLKQTASGGIASTISGGLSSITGLGGLISGIASLFGGGNKPTLPPLVKFQLPGSETQTLYVSSAETTTYQGSAVEQSGAPNPSTSIYSRAGTTEITNAGSRGQSLQHQSMQIAQAVKAALLNSSSLNDVIAEI